MKKVRSSFIEYVLDQNRRVIPSCSRLSRKEVFIEQRDSKTKEDELTKEL